MKTFTLILNELDLEAIHVGLMLAPYGKAAPLFQKINQQIAEQTAPPAAPPNEPPKS